MRTIRQLTAAALLAVALAACTSAPAATPDPAAAPTEAEPAEATTTDAPEPSTTASDAATEGDDGTLPVADPASQGAATESLRYYDRNLRALAAFDTADSDVTPTDRRFHDQIAEDGSTDGLIESADEFATFGNATHVRCVAMVVPDQQMAVLTVSANYDEQGTVTSGVYVDFDGDGQLSADDVLHNDDGATALTDLGCNGG